MIDRDIQKFVLRALLLRNGDPLSAREIKLRVRGAFDAAFTEGELDSYLAALEEMNLIAGTQEELTGTVWGLTPKGKIRAQALVRT